MLKLTNCSASWCRTGFVFVGGIEAELINTHANNCKIGFLQMATEQEFQLLLDKVMERPEVLEQLVRDYGEASPEKKSEVISKSTLFEYLSVFANAAAVFTFVKELVNSIIGK